MLVNFCMPHPQTAARDVPLHTAAVTPQPQTARALTQQRHHVVGGQAPGFSGIARQPHHHTAIRAVAQFHPIGTTDPNFLRTGHGHGGVGARNSRRTCTRRIRCLLGLHTLTTGRINQNQITLARTSPDAAIGRLTQHGHNAASQTAGSGRFRPNRLKLLTAAAQTHEAVPRAHPQVTTAIKQQRLDAIIGQRTAGARVVFKSRGLGR